MYYKYKIIWLFYQPNFLYSGFTHAKNKKKYLAAIRLEEKKYSNIPSKKPSI